MACTKALFSLFTVNSPECGANKVDLDSSVYNQINNYVSNQLTNSIGTGVLQGNKITIEQLPGTKVENCNIEQTNTSNISVVNQITQQQTTELINTITNEVTNELTQEQQQAILQAFEGEGKSNIAEITNDLKTIISNTVEQNMNNFINTAVAQDNEIKLKIGNWDCNGKAFSQKNISEIAVDNLLTSVQDTLSSNDVVNKISNAISQKNTSGLADIIKYMVIAAAVLGIVTVFGGLILGIFKLKSGQKTCSTDAECGPNATCKKGGGLGGEKVKGLDVGKNIGTCVPKSGTAKSGATTKSGTAKSGATTKSSSNITTLAKNL
jgi:hypothetical protein